MPCLGLRISTFQFELKGQASPLFFEMFVERVKGLRESAVWCEFLEFVLKFLEPLWRQEVVRQNTRVPKVQFCTNGLE